MINENKADMIPTNYKSALSISFVSLCFVVMLFVFLTDKSNASFQISGEECQPANLNQALSLGLGWSQFGVTNNAPIGASGFFVVCPIDRSVNALYRDYFEIQAVFLNPNAQDIECIFFTLFSTVVRRGVTIPISNPGNTNNVSIKFPLDYDELAIRQNLVCALPPQARIAKIISVDSSGFY